MTSSIFSLNGYGKPPITRKALVLEYLERGFEIVTNDSGDYFITRHDWQGRISYPVSRRLGRELVAEEEE